MKKQLVQLRSKLSALKSAAAKGIPDADARKMNLRLQIQNLEKQRHILTALISQSKSAQA